MTSQLTVPSLCRTIRALIAKGDHAREKAEQAYWAAGKHCGELKERNIPILPLFRTTKALIAKGERARKKAEQFYSAACEHIAELRERCPDEWLEHVQAMDLQTPQDILTELLDSARGLTFYTAPGAPGNTPEEDKMLRAHEDEAERYKAEFWNYGKVVGAGFILSKTGRGILETHIDPNTAAVSHHWSSYE